MKLLSVALLSLLCLACLTLSARPKMKQYTMAHLEELAQAESWGELFSHLSDIPPGKRTKKWNALVEKAAVGMLGEESDPSQRGSMAKDFVKKYPVLKDSEAFRESRKPASSKKKKSRK